MNRPTLLRRLRPALTLFEKLLRLRARFARSGADRANASRTRLGMETLEDRVVPAITGVVWFDANADGIQDGGESLVDGADVGLFDDGVPFLVSEAYTDVSGEYSFAVIGSGPFSVSVTPASGTYRLSTAVDGNGRSFVPTSGTADPIGLVGTGDELGGQGTIGGTVWFDANANGVLDGGESGADSLTVTLVRNGSTVTTTSTVDGAYEFTDLWGGNYSLEVSGGYAVSTPVNGSGRTNAALAPGGAATPDIGLTGFGDMTGGLGTISGVVFEDTNANGIQGVGEDGIESVPVTLYLGGVSVATAYTNSEGEYEFTDLWGGPYQLDATVSDHFISTPVNTLGRTNVPLAGSTTATAFASLGFAPGSATPVNDPPAVTVPSAQSTPLNTDLVFSTGNSNAITVSDPDAASSDLEVTLSVERGVFTLATTSGLSFTAGDGTNDSAMTFTGTLTEINAALDGLTYTPPADFVGGDVLTILIDDQGNTGSGGAKTATALVNLSILPAVAAIAAPVSGGPDPTGPTLVAPPTSVSATSLGDSAAGLTGNNPGGTSGPVRYADGAVVFSETDLWSSGFGVGWGQARSWTNKGGYAPDNTTGAGMVNTGQPFLLSLNGGDTIAIVRSGTRADYYDVADSVWFPRFYGQDVLTYNGGEDEFVLTDTLGNVTKFHDFSGGIAATQQGRLKQFADAAGNVVSVSYADGILEAVTRTATVGGVTVTESFLYTYLEDPDVNAGLVATVTLQRQVDADPAETVRSVEYGYYDGEEDFGNLGDLKLAVVKDGSGDPIDTRYYRYYVNEEANGYEHGLKFFLKGDAYTRMTEDLGTDLGAISDNDLAPYADLHFEYDEEQRVTLAVVQGEGCSVCASGLGEYAYEYTESENDPGVNSWKMKTVETIPDGNTNTVYTNVYGQVMLSVYTDTGTEDEWANFSQFDVKGRVLLAAGPSAVTGFNDTYADLLHWDDGDYEFLSDDAGQIALYGYGADTTATDSTAGDVEGYQSYTAIAHGETGTAILMSSEQYLAHTEGGATVFKIAHVTQYRNDDGTGAQTTSYAYTYLTDTNLVESVTTTLPVVSAEQNGSGTASAMTTVLDIYGRPIWSKDAAGVLSYVEYDLATGAVVKTIQDVNYETVEDFNDLPYGWETPEGGGAHLITLYQVDSLGRTTKVTTPEGRVTFVVYNDANHEVRSYSGWDSDAHHQTGTITVSREDREHGYTETLTMSVTPDLNGSDEPAGTEAIGEVQSLSRSYTNEAGQVIYSDVYFDLGGLAYSTDPDIGAEGGNFYRTRFQYDSDGRLTRTVHPQGTIYRTEFDGQGRAVSEWIGTDDTPTEGYWSPDNLDGTNMVKVRAYEYDGGGVGDGNLTKVTEFPDGDTDPRVTLTWFDWRDRAVAVKAGVEESESTSVNRPLTYFNFDNIGNVVETRVFDADDQTPTITDGVPQPLDSELLRAQSVASFDELGRAFRSETYSVNPSSGSVSSSTLRTDTWFDARGFVVKSASMGGLVQKIQFDSLGRAVVTYWTDGGGDVGYADAGNVDGDVVLEQYETLYDDDGLTLANVSRQRFHDAEGTGVLGDPGSGIGARVSYVGYYYDLGARLLARVDVGTNGGSAWDRLSVVDVPDRDAVTSVTSFGYAADAVQVVALTEMPTGGTFTLSFGGYTTGNIAYNASPATVQTALEALTSIGADNVVVSAALWGGWEVRFTGSMAGQYQVRISANGSGLTGGGSPNAVVSTISAGGDTGRIVEVTDPAGRVNRTYFDALGQTLRTIQNFVDGVVSDGDDKTVSYTYEGTGTGMTSLTAHLTGGGGEMTQWLFGVTTGGGSLINSNDLMGTTRWPDETLGSASTGEQEITTFNALGQVLTKSDRNGNVHTFGYDVLGRLVSDAVTTLGVGEDVDGAVRRIEYAYDGQNNVYLITSYDAASDGNIVNQVKREFNGLGQLTKEWQSHDGAVTSETPKVQYAYAEMAEGVNDSRLTSITYASGYVLAFNYSAGLNDTVGRLSSLSDNSGTLESYDYLGQSTVVVRNHPQPNLTQTFVGTPGDAGDQYAGLDRFGRVVDQLWKHSSTVVSDHQYGYDILGNRLWRDDLVNTDFGELYSYDDFSQLTGFARGELNGGHTALTGDASRAQSWNHDALGNFDSVTTDGDDPVTRTHNAQNEITSISGATTPTYDKNGNMTGDETGRTLVYDAWNRLVAVKDGATVLKSYGYDGLNRRVTETVDAVTTDLIYSAEWQVLEASVAGSTTTRYVWSPVYVDAMVLRDRDTDNNGTLDERLWVVQDANWNIVALVNGSGAVVERYVYDAFGVRTVLDASYTPIGDSAYGFNHGFQGMAFDAVAGLNPQRERWYSPTLGRWVTVDPIRFEAGDVNLYRYETNGVLNRLDPSGLVDVAGVGQSIAGGATDQAFYPDPKNITWDYFKIINKLPLGANEKWRAFTSASLNFTTGEPEISVMKLPLCGWYVATARVYSINIRAQFNFSASWFYDDPLNKLDPAFKAGPLLNHERYHYTMAVKFANLATARWNKLFAKSGVSAIGAAKTPEAAINEAKANLHRKIASNVKLIDSQIQKLTDAYDSIAPTVDPKTGAATYTDESQRVAQKRADLSIDMRLTDAFKQFYNQK